MLMHINKVELQFDWHDDRKPSIERVIRTYINPERVSNIMFDPDGIEGYACIQCGVKEHWVTNEEAERILECVNGGPEAAYMDLARAMLAAIQETAAPSVTEERLKEQLEREIEEMHKHFAKPEGDA